MVAITVREKLVAAMKAAEEKAAKTDYSVKLASIGDQVTWLSLDGLRKGKVTKVNSKTVQVAFPADKLGQSQVVILKREFAHNGQQKGRFNQFKLEGV